MIFQNIAEIKNHVGGAINTSMEIENLNPFIEQGLASHLSPLAGQMVDDFIDDPTIFDNKTTDLLKKIAAFIGVYEYSFIANVQFSESGLIRTESENVKAAYKYQTLDFRNKMVSTAYQSIESLLIYLDNQETAPANYEAIPNTFIRYARDMRKYYSSNIDRYTFESMRIVSDDVENWLSVNFPMPFWEKIKEDNQKEPSTLTAPELELLVHLRKAIANFTIKEAIKRNIVTQIGRNIVTKTQTENIETQSAPSSNNLFDKIYFTDNWGSLWLKKLEILLKNNIDGVGFELYKEAQEVEEPCKQPNRKRKKKNILSL